jgi:hypothetical protein
MKPNLVSFVQKLQALLDQHPEITLSGDLDGNVIAYDIDFFDSHTESYRRDCQMILPTAAQDLPSETH